MITLQLKTTIDFESRDAIESFVQSLPLNSIQKRLIMEGESVVDRLDDIEWPGSSNTRHQFKVKFDKTEEK